MKSMMRPSLHLRGMVMGIEFSLLTSDTQNFICKKCAAGVLHLFLKITASEPRAITSLHQLLLHCSY